MKEWLVSFSGEIGTKSPGTQKDFKALVLKNLKTRTIGFDYEWEEIAGRLLMRGEEGLETFLKTHIGFSAFSPLFRFSGEASLEALPLAHLLPQRPFTFTVYLKRSKNEAQKERLIPYQKALLAYLEKEARQRLQSSWDNRPPEKLDWSLEGHGDEIWLLLGKNPAPGGLPVGCGEKFLVLFSGGPDSMLAAYLLARRGQEIELVFFDDQVEGRREQVLKQAEELAFYLPHRRVRFWLVPYQKALERLSTLVPKRKRCLFCKALMIDWASIILKKAGAKALATGEILGEQASQTLPALLFISQNRPIFRPLLTFNKEEVFSSLEKAGFSLPQTLPSCPFSPKHPLTRPQKSPSQLLGILQKLKNLFSPKAFWVENKSFERG